jgi:hypothetical protein
MDLKRDAIKYVRDKAKRSYKKTGVCEICFSEEGVDFHHYNSVTELFNKWVRENSIELTCEEDVLSVREQFILEHEQEMFHECANLCHKHHEQLHKLYGKHPNLSTAPKQRRWVELQKQKYREKANGPQSLDSQQTQPRPAPD